MARDKYITASGGFPTLVFEVPQEPNFEDPDCVGVKILDFNENTKQLTEQFPNDYREIIIPEKRVTNSLIVGTSKNMSGQLAQLTKNIPGGPWSMDGRDGVLTIHNRKISRPITKVYTYDGGNGELLFFKVKSKFVKSSVEIGKNSDVDPDSKDVQVTTSQVIHDEDKPNVDGYLHWGRRWEDTAPDMGGFPDPNAGDPRNRLSNQPVYMPMDSTALANAQKASRERIMRQQVNKNEPEEQPIVYSSEQDARQSIAASTPITQEEVDQFIAQLKERYSKRNNPTTESELDQAIHGCNQIGEYTITRKVRVRKVVDPVDYDPTESLKRRSSSSYRGNIHPNAQHAKRGVAWDRGYDHLKKMPGVVIEKRISGNVTSDWGTKLGMYDKVEIIQEVDMQVPINGARILASAAMANCGVTMGNDIEEVVTNQVKAEANVVGNPFLESSMNFQIQNVSSRYSGTWYSKKVTHTINASSGYLCDIDFVQRDIPISKNIIKANLVVQKAMADLAGVADKAIETGSYMRISKLEHILEDYKQKYPEYSFIAVETEKGSGKFAIYSSKEDFSASFKEGGDPPQFNDLTQVGSVDL